MPASPFQASGETSPGKNDDLPRTIAGSTPLPLGRRSFAVSGPLAPVRSASYPVPVRRLTGSFHASFSVRLTTNALRFPSVPATRFREDFHLQVIAHAGPTTTDGGDSWERVLFVDENTGGVDVVMDPNNPRILFAATWQMFMRTWGRWSGGPGSGIYMSRDAGDSWERLEGRGLPSGTMGKIRARHDRLGLGPHLRPHRNELES